MQARYKLLPYEDLRLHTAALDGDLAMVKKLIEQGSNVHSRDIFMSTPLHLAAFNGHTDVVATLIEAGAKVDSVSYKNTTPLFLAVKNQHLDVISLLVEHGANPNHTVMTDSLSSISSSPFLSVIDQLSMDIEATFFSKFNNEHRISISKDLEIFRILANPETGTPLVNQAFGELTIPASILMNILSKVIKEPESREKANEVIDNITIPSLHNLYVDTKNLLHTFPFGKTYHLIEPKTGELVIQSDGHWRYWTTPLARESIKHFIEHIPKETSLMKHSFFTSILSVLENSERYIDNSYLPNTARDILEIIHSGELVLLPTGWRGHAINLLFYQDYMIVCNSGERHDLKAPGAMIYQITHPENINEELVFYILNNQSQMDMEYDLHYILGLNALNLIDFPEQVFGNCAWYSFLPTIESMLFLKLSEMGMDLDHAQSIAHDYFEEWHDFHKTWILDEYLENYPDSSFEILMDLFIHEAKNIDEKSNFRANAVLEVLSEPPFDHELANFVTNQPLYWLKLDDVLQDAGINLQTGRKGGIDILQFTDYNEPDLAEQAADPMSFSLISPLPSLEEIPVFPVEF